MMISKVIPFVFLLGPPPKKTMASILYDQESRLLTCTFRRSFDTVAAYDHKPDWEADMLAQVDRALAERNLVRDPTLRPGFIRSVRLLDDGIAREETVEAHIKVLPIMTMPVD